MAAEGSSPQSSRLTSQPPDSMHCSFCDKYPETDHTPLNITNAELGWAQDHLRRLVEPGFHTRAPNGTNALATTAERLHAWGGHLSFTMNPEFVVTLWLPGAGAEPLPSEPPAESTADILIVDDEMAVSGYLGEIVSRAGHRCAIFNDPQAALSHFREQPEKYALVISDLSMPGLSGDAMIQAMREARSDLPVILCTGYNEPVDGSLDPDTVTCLSKPVRAGRLLQAVEKQLDMVRPH